MDFVTVILKLTIIKNTRRIIMRFVIMFVATLFVGVLSVQAGDACYKMSKSNTVAKSCVAADGKCTCTASCTCKTAEGLCSCKDKCVCKQPALSCNKNADCKATCGSEGKCVLEKSCKADAKSCSKK